MSTTEVIVYQQTRGGMYHSAPRVEDVARALLGEVAWQAPYQNAGHGEYVENVYEAAEIVRRLIETARCEER